MKDVRRGRRDWIWLVMTAISPIVLAGMIVAAAVAWQVQRGRLDGLIGDALTSVGVSTAVSGNAAMAVAYDAKTSKDETENWLAVLSATTVLNDKYGGPFAWAVDGPDGVSDFERIVPPGQQWEAASIVADYAADAEPMLQQLRSTLDSDVAIWVPTFFRSHHTMLPEMQAARDVVRVLRYCFANEVHNDRNERAIEILAIMDRLFGADVEAAFLVEELVRLSAYSVELQLIRDSVAANVWSEDELKRIDRMIAKPFDLQARLSATLDFEALSSYPLSTDGDRGGQGNEFPFDLHTISLSPSTLASWIEDHNAIARTPVATTLGELQSIDASDWDRRYSRPVPLAIDQWLQIPTMDGRWALDWILTSYGSIQESIARHQNEIHWTRTVMAMRRFELAKGYFPQSLSELTEVGLPTSAMQAFDGGPFAWEETDSDGRLVYNQAEKAVTYAYFGTEAKSVRLEATKK